MCVVNGQNSGNENRNRKNKNKNKYCIKNIKKFIGLEKIMKTYVVKLFYAFNIND